MLQWIMQYWLAIAFGAFSAVTVALWKQYKHLKRGIMALLFMTLRQCYDQYTEKNEIPIDMLEFITNIYEAYTFFGGNGTGTKMYEILKELPTSKPK